MRIFKILFWGLMIAAITLIISQNLEFFASVQKLKINLWFWQYETPQTLNGIVFVGFFVSGFLFCYIIDFIELFKSKRAVKNLNRECDKHVEEIGVLKNKLESLQKTSVVTPAPEPQTPPADASGISQTQTDLKQKE